MIAGRSNLAARRRSRRSVQVVAAWVLFATLFLAAPIDVLAQTQVARTKHNLTASGPGTVRTNDTIGVCVFCHTPHNANPTRGLWNRNLSGTTYQLYASGSLQSQVNQPTGSSRLCLSCHDGVLAFADIRISARPVPTGLAVLTGAMSFGRDLAASHPVSLVYDAALAHRRGELADPASLPPVVPLDNQRQLQCTSCHDPHDERRPDFLRMDTRAGALCLTCHRPLHWGGSAHATSAATWTGTGANPWPAGTFTSVGENGCLSCHRSHAAAHAQRLLNQPTESGNCTLCHNGKLAVKNVEAEFSKPSRHPIESTPWTHEPYENPSTMPRHVACADCHNPHAATAAQGGASGLSGPLLGVPGVAAGGSTVNEARYEYEVCFKCHGLREPTTIGITRQSGTRNISVKMGPSSRSSHPVVTPGTATSTASLVPGYTGSGAMTCTSCHNNDEWTLSGPASRGPHGSRFTPILERQYSTADPTPESPQSYELCYECHNRASIINDQARAFPHNKHVVALHTPCAACHDAHGSRQNAHLIDFMVRDRINKPVVTPSAAQKRLEYVSLGPGRGQCYLQCHGVNHEPKTYP